MSKELKKGFVLTNEEGRYHLIFDNKTPAGYVVENIALASIHATAKEAEQKINLAIGCYKWYVVEIKQLESGEWTEVGMNMNTDDWLKSDSKETTEPGELIKCPNCNHEFDSNDTFSWLLDGNGHPTIEHLSCPSCGVATEPIFNCSVCPSENKCTLEEECGATLFFPFEKWIK